MLGRYITVRSNDPEADFWLVRKGAPGTVGTPTRSFSPEHIGVTAGPALLPDYLFYWLVALHESGYFQALAKGTLPLQHITHEDVKSAPLPGRAR